jgi:hypothetical protein
MLVNEVIANHRLLWHTIAKICRDKETHWEFCDSTEVKDKALREMGYDGYNSLNFGCFCCEYTGYNAEDSRNGDGSKCKYCPIDWGVNYYPSCIVSYFDSFCEALSEECIEEAADVADRIAELPINPYYIGKSGI